MLPVLIFLTFIPTFFWFFVFLQEEKYDPIPKKLLTRVFILGGIGALVASGFELLFIFNFPNHIRDVFLHLEKIKTLELNLAIGIILLTVILACFEEVIKIAVVKIFAYNSQSFNQVVDGAVLGISAALGFATIENLFYFATALKAGLITLIVVFIARFLATTLLHATASGISGYYLGKEKFTGEKGVFLKGLLVAMLTHSVFNLFLLGGVVGVLFEIVFLIIMFIFLLRKMESTEAQVIWKLIFFKKN